MSQKILTPFKKPKPLPISQKAYELNERLSLDREAGESYQQAEELERVERWQEQQEYMRWVWEEMNH